MNINCKGKLTNVLQSAGSVGDLMSKSIPSKQL